jgi:hypothetical protein
MAGHEQLTIQLPHPDAEFAREFANRNKISVSELVDRLLKNLQRVSKQEVSLTVQSWIGILPSDMDVDAVRLDYLTKKYLTDEDNG